MVFTSLQFVIFFIIVFGLYLACNHKWQNRMLLVASYVFYSAWDWRFSSLILFSTILNYICGHEIFKSKDYKRRKIFLFISIIGNIGMLAFFKYFNFFLSNLYDLVRFFGYTGQLRYLNIILPLGISFYTFQSMSYTIDIYRKAMEPTRKFFDFALFVAFFPQLVAGPIERAKHLLPQILNPRKITLDKFHEGCYLIFFGVFQKIFVADNLAKIVDPIFAGFPPYDGSKTVLAAYAFAFQVFCDFAGYSNIARGLGKCMGFDIVVNFNVPYLATNIQDFWQRWHISLSSWIKDYLYFPLFFSLKILRGKTRGYITQIITMGIMGLWHGAAWTFIIWGLYHGILLAIYTGLKPKICNLVNPKSYIGREIWFFARAFFMLSLVSLGGVIFRAQSMLQAKLMLQSLICDFSLASLNAHHVRNLIFYVWFIMLIEVIRHKTGDLNILRHLPIFVRINALLYMGYSVMLMGVLSGEEFVYFQF